MFRKYLITFIGLIFTNYVFSAESLLEKANDQMNDLNRTTNEKMNRLKEKTCMRSEIACLKQKAENRVEEASDSISDKAIEIKNSIDSDDNP